MLRLGKCGVVHFRSISGGRKGADKEQKGLLVLFFQPGITEIEQSEDEQSAGLEESSLPNLGRDITSNMLFQDI